MSKQAGWGRLVGSVALAACVVLFASAVPGSGVAGPLLQAAPVLGTAQSFAVLGGSAVTNTGPSIISGDLGVSPGSSVTGFPPGVISGTLHVTDAVAAQAQSDLTGAYNTLAGEACNFDVTGQDLGGQTLTPGVYCFSTSASLTGTLTLNAQGNPNAVFIFKVGSTLTTASASTVLLINGADPCNVFWQVGSSATLGTASSFVGNILALTSITATTGASVDGRILARNGAVTLDTNTVTASFCAAAPIPTFTATATNTATATATPLPATATALAATATSAAATATSAAAATATAIGALPPATQTAIALLPPALQTAIALLPPATQTAIAIQTASAVATHPSPEDDDDDEDDQKETEQERRQRERTNNSNRDDYATEGNVLRVVCALPMVVTTTTPTVTVTPTLTVTVTPTLTATATITPTAYIPVQVPAGEETEPALTFSAFALALGLETDEADVPYVIIGTRDGDQKVRLQRDARASCSSIRVGDYLEADGEKQHELLFDATDVTVLRGGRRVR